MDLTSGLYCKTSTLYIEWILALGFHTSHSLLLRGLAHLWASFVGFRYNIKINIELWIKFIVFYPWILLIWQVSLNDKIQVCPIPSKSAIQFRRRSRSYCSRILLFSPFPKFDSTSREFAAVLPELDSCSPDFPPPPLWWVRTNLWLLQNFVVWVMIRWGKCQFASVVSWS